MLKWLDMSCSMRQMCANSSILQSHISDLPASLYDQDQVQWQVQADVRTIISRDFATRHSLRFPRVERIRYDKSPFDVQTDQQLWDLVNQNKGVVTGEQLPTTAGPGNLLPTLVACALLALACVLGLQADAEKLMTCCCHDLGMSMADHESKSKQQHHKPCS